MRTKNVCNHGIHMDNACGACIPPRGTTIREKTTKPSAALNERVYCGGSPVLPAPSFEPSAAQDGQRKGMSALSLAAIGRKHFGNPIPKEWYAAARDLLATRDGTERSGEKRIEPDNECVICPQCTHQFRAILAHEDKQ